MSKVHEHLYREIWDELSRIDPDVNLDAVDAEFLTRVILDIDAGKVAACKAARRTVDTARTKFRDSQLALPTMADLDEYIVIGDSERYQRAYALDQHMLLALELSDQNLKKQFDANQTRHSYYRMLAKYLHQGMTHNAAVEQYWRDNPTTRAIV